MAPNLLRSCFCLISAGTFIAGCTIVLIPVAQITIGAVYIHQCPVAPFIPVYVIVCGLLALLVMGLLALPKLHCPAALDNKIWTISLGLCVLLWLLCGSYQVYSLYPPNYVKNTTDPNKTNNSIHTPAVPDNKLSLTPQNQNQSLPDANHTSNNQTLRKAILALATSNISTKINGEHLNAPQAALYCDRTLYLFAFWTTTLLCVLAGNMLVIILCLYGFMYVGNRIRLTT